MKNRLKIIKKCAALLLLFAILIANRYNLFDSLFSYFGLDGNVDYNYVSFLDVGQADCSLIHSDGKFVLIDSGGNFDDGIKVLRALRQRNVRKIDYIIISHDHTDHAGGIDEILSNLSVGAIVCSETAFDDSESEFENDVLEVSNKYKTPIVTAKSGDSIVVEDAKIDFIWFDKNAAENDDSLVCLLTMDNTRFLFSGDITSKTERKMLDNNVDVSCDVLKAAHHGSKSGSCNEFLAAAQPTYCVVSCGEDNQYGFPSADFLKRIKQHDIQLYVTADDGHITFNTTNNNISLKK